jgi:hypothetical protein
MNNKVTNVNNKTNKPTKVNNMNPKILPRKRVKFSLTSAMPHTVILFILLSTKTMTEIFITFIIFRFLIVRIPSSYKGDIESFFYFIILLRFYSFIKHTQ